jgi:hypothetical protein
MDFIAGPPVCGRIVADILRESLRLKLLKGGNMETEKVLDERMPAETANVKLIRCGSCHRELKSPAEWICGDQHIICDVCYQNLLNPNKKISFEH